MVREGRPSCVKDHLSLLSSSIHHRTHISGEVSGMIAAASLITGVSPGNEAREKEEVVSKLAAVFTSQLGDALRDGMKIVRMQFSTVPRKLSIIYIGHL